MMKRVFTLLLILLSINTYSQVVCDSTFRDYSHHILKNLDKSLIPSGVLYEYVFPFADVNGFTGQTDTDTTNHYHFLQAYQELYQSSVNSLDLLHPKDFYDNINNFSANPEYHHPIGIIDFDFNSIDTNAIDNNLLYLDNGMLYDVPGRSASPYINHKARLAMPLLADDYDEFSGGSMHYFHFKDEFVLTNNGFNLSQVNHVEIKLDGNTQFSSAVSGLNNYVVPIYFSNQDQEIEVDMKLTMDMYHIYYKIFISGKRKVSEILCDGGYKVDLTGYPFDGGYGEGYYSAKGKANIYFANDHCISQELKKVIIFVDGFDPNNKMNHRKLWDEYLNREFTDVDATEKKLGTELRSFEKGYDIIFLDQVADRKYNSGSGGLIENNGLVLAKLLVWLQENHGDTIEDIVVVGASMGGLVARFGLAWMEANNIPHHVRLFISFDSPQAGAHIPIGLQYTLDDFIKYGYLESFPKIRNALHQSHAAKQMLLHHSSHLSETVKHHSFRDIFLNNLEAVGNWPTQCRVVSIVNGNRVGQLKTSLPIPNDFDAETIGPSETIVELGIRKRWWASPFCSGDGCYKFLSKVYAQPESGRTLVSTFKTRRRNIVLIILAGAQSRSYYAQGLNGTSLDIAPGARVGVNFFEALNIPWIKNTIKLMVGRPIVNINKSIHNNFIPTVSSVAYKFPVEPHSYYKDFTGINLSKCAGTTPFDTVYAPNYDMPHVMIDAFIAQSFRNEVYNHFLPSSCSNPCPEHYVNQSKVEQNITFQAERSIQLNPGFEVPAGKVFKTQIGCNQGLSGKPSGSNTNQMLMATCDFEWDTGKMDSWCEGEDTRYHIFVRNVPYHTYAEFSADDSLWYQPSIGGSGMEFLLPGHNGWTLYARLKDDPSNVIQYTFSPCRSDIQFDDSMRTKLCEGTQITQTVYIDNLPGGAIAQFSLDGGASWTNANEGDSGFAYTHTPTNSYINYMARSSTDPGYKVSSQFHSSCSNISSMDWGSYTINKGQPGNCVYGVSVTGLAIDSHAEFSVDNGESWYKAQVGNYGHVFILHRGHGTHQEFWFRPMEYPKHLGVWGHLPVCDF